MLLAGASSETWRYVDKFGVGWSTSIDQICRGLRDILENVGIRTISGKDQLNNIQLGDNIGHLAKASVPQSINAFTTWALACVAPPPPSVPPPPAMEPGWEATWNAAFWSYTFSHPDIVNGEGFVLVFNELPEPGLNLYDVLAVDFECSTKEISKAFRRLSLHFHPDKQHGSATNFRIIKNAQRVLTDVALRRVYDLGGERAVCAVLQKPLSDFENIPSSYWERT